MRSWMIAAAAGIGLVAYLPALPSVSSLLWIALVAFVCLYVRLYIITALAAGFCWAVLYGTWLVAGQLPPELEGQDLVAIGRVCSIPDEAGQVLRFDLCADRLTDARTGVPVSGALKLRLSWYRDYRRLMPNEPVALQLRLKRPQGFMNPAGFDREAWLFANGYGATGYVRQVRELETTLPVSGMAALQAARYALVTSLRDTTPHLNHLSSVEALTLGIKGNLTQDQWELLSRTGTTHLLVISGMHIGLFAGLAFWVFKRLWLRSSHLAVSIRADIPGAIAAVVAAFLYMLLSGAGVPAQRAFFMVALGMLGMFAIRRFRPSSVFSAAILGVLTLDPLAVRAAGFWLSFGAVAAIGMGLSSRLRGWQAGKMIQLVRVQWAVTFLLIPPLLVWFGQISWVSFLVNLLAIPLVTLLIAPCALLGVLCMQFSEIMASPMLWVADMGLTLFWSLVEVSAEQPWATQSVRIPLWWSVPLLILCLLSAGPRRLPGQLLCMTVLLVWWYPAVVHKGNELNITVLDVGQGLSVLGAQGSHALLYDAGPLWNDDFDAGSSVVVPNLMALQLTQLHTTIVSHGDSDHAGGLRSVMSKVPTLTLLAGEPQRVFVGEADAQAVQVAQCEAGQRFSVGDATVEVLWPPPERVVPEPELRPVGAYRYRNRPVRKSNDQSCVLRILYGPWSMLLTGDITAAVERELVKRYGAELRSTVLLLPHHGSKTSSTSTFLKFVDPALAVVSSGYRNRFGHPAREVVDRLARLNIPLLNTASSGAIRLVFTQEALLVESERMNRLGYWYNRPQGENRFNISAAP